MISPAQLPCVSIHLSRYPPQVPKNLKLLAVPMFELFDNVNVRHLRATRCMRGSSCGISSRIADSCFASCCRFAAIRARDCRASAMSLEIPFRPSCTAGRGYIAARYVQRGLLFAGSRSRGGQRLTWPWCPPAASSPAAAAAVRAPGRLLQAKPQQRARHATSSRLGWMQAQDIIINSIYLPRWGGSMQQHTGRAS